MSRATPQLLLIGGSDDDARWVHRALASENGVVRLERLGATEDPRVLLSTMRFDAVLVDLLSSRFEAAGWRALFEKVGQRGPLVVLADARDEARLVEWLSAGASDWVFRPGFLGLSAVLARLSREAREVASAEARERQLREATAALVALTRTPSFLGDEVGEMAREVTEAGARGLGVDRCGVWLLSDDRHSLRLIDVFDVATMTHEQGNEWSRREFPAFFEALESSRWMAVAQAPRDARTRELFERSLRPLDISSTIDVALRVRGELVGVLCVEHRGPPRRWSAAEEVFAGALADVVSLALESADRRRVETALRDSERRFRDLFRYTSDTIVLYRVSIEGRVFCEDVNPAGEQSIGVTRDQVLGKEAHEVFPTGAAPRHQERYAHAIESRAPVVFEHELSSPTGLHVFNTALIPMLDETGRVQRLASITRDVTAQRAPSRAPFVASPHASDARAPVEGDAPGAGGPHLMLVDDHPGMARVSAKLLETLGYRTTVFDDPRQALEAFRQAPQGFDAVLTDLSMPQMSGEEFTQSLRAVRPTLPVIISTGMAGSVDPRELKRLGVSAVLLKPWRLDEAIETLKRVLPR